MSTASDFDLIIVGLGSAGMVGAEFAAGLGLRVAAVERDRVGGDCLWTGCVPSKALLASAKVAHLMRHAGELGLEPVDVRVDTAKVWARLKQVQRDIAGSDDDPARFEAMGVALIRGTAEITGPTEVTVRDLAGTRVLTAGVILLCTGSHPTVPPIEGLEHAGFLTSDSIFELERAPDSIVIVGGGPVGVELAQALNRLGTRVTLLASTASILPHDESALTAILQRILISEGVDVRVGAEAIAVRRDAHGKHVDAMIGGEKVTITADEVLVAVGRTPAVERLGLDAVGVTLDSNGIVVDGRGRTSVRTIYAAGDLTGRHLFTHAAAFESVRSLRDAFFPGRGATAGLVPWCTFTDPELAHAGRTIAEAEADHGDDVDVWRADLEHNDRARADGTTAGAVIVVTVKGRIIGAHVLAPHAGEMIHELALAIERQLKLADVASLVHIYPTLSTATGQLAAQSVFERARQLRWLVRRR